MSKKIKVIIAALVAIILLVVVAGIYKFDYLSGKTGYDVDGNKINESSFNYKGISTKIPSSLGKVYTKNFNRYTRLKTPNGGSIHIVAQNKITDGQIVRARNVLSHYLTDYPGSKFGADKSAVANKMAENNAVLCLLNGQDDGSNPVASQANCQPLYQNEMQVEGHDWYMKQDYEHRDATFEEILHFVHDNGIGIDGNLTFKGVLPDYQKDIRSAQKNGLDNDLWGRDKAWIKELSRENSLSQEYLASVIDSYYGLWGAWSEGEGGMRGVYIAKTRDEVKSKDSQGYDVVGKFFHPYLTYNAQIDANLNGNFSLKFDPKKSYTHHSQYLKDVTLLGKNNNSVTVNQLDNHITGNSGENTVIFSGESSQYKITKDGAKTIVTDTVSDRDGKNTLSGVEKLHFSDKIVRIK